MFKICDISYLESSLHLVDTNARPVFVYASRLSMVWRAVTNFTLGLKSDTEPTKCALSVWSHTNDHVCLVVNNGILYSTFYYISFKNYLKIKSDQCNYI